MVYFLAEYVPIGGMRLLLGVKEFRRFRQHYKDGTVKTLGHYVNYVKLAKNGN